MADRPQPPALEILDAAAMPLRGWNFGRWQFPYWRMYWADQRGTHVLSDQPIAVDQRHVVLVPPRTTVGLRQDRPVRHFYCHFVVGAPFHHPRRRLCRIPSDAWMRQAQEHLLHTFVGDGRSATNLLTLTALIWRSLQSLPPDHWSADGMDPRVQDTMLHIERSLGEPLTCEHLADRAGLCPDAFARLFRRHVGQSLHQYILNQRIQAAATRLLATDLSIKQIATSCGFCDRYHFSRTFRRLRGTSPAAFRRGPLSHEP